jgi:thiosulfate/3-mercaptopyruvate sulfurtransferase
MPFTTIVSSETLTARLSDPAWAIIDSRFDLSRPGWGEAEYRAGHIPGAVYAHLERDLSGPRTGRNGRHPLPEVNAFKQRLGQWGIGPGVQVVVYDQVDGQFASRLWWMLRALGHDAVAVLEGGWATWRSEGRPQRGGDESRPPAVFSGAVQLAGAITPDQAGRMGQDTASRLLDARLPERYRGEVEPIDPAAGHIPGAVNYPYKRSLQADGAFRPPAEVRAALEAVLGEAPADQAAVYCGSGVTACHVILAAEYAGLPGLKLYPGSWSEWIADPARPIAKSKI